jgi:hypothetical protein
MIKLEQLQFEKDEIMHRWKGDANKHQEMYQSANEKLQE